MRISEQDKANLKRFGSTLHPRENLLCVRWTDLGRDQAVAANIVVRTIFAQCAGGPMLCLAFEISPTRALAHYCYFPINLENQTLRAYLTSLAQHGQVHLAFVSGRRFVSRTYQLLPTQRKQVAGMHSKAMEALEACSNYKFSEVVEEFERTIRIPQFFDRVVSDEDISRNLESLRAKADDLSTDKRTLAHQVVHGLADVLKTRHGEKVHKFLTDMLGARTAFLTLFDYQREFGDDYERIVNALTDHVALNTPDEALRKASDWPRKLESILKTLEDVNTSPEQKAKLNSEVRVAIGRVLDYLSRGRGLSISVLKDIVLPFRALLPAQPGRPTEDYGEQYGWKASGMSWTEVAMKYFEDNPDVRAEFGGQDFGSLTLEEKELLKGRIREGVRSYAEREGKPFPLPELASIEAQKI